MYKFFGRSLDTGLKDWFSKYWKPAVLIVLAACLLRPLVLRSRHQASQMQKQRSGILSLTPRFVQSTEHRRQEGVCATAKEMLAQKNYRGLEQVVREIRKNHL